MENDGMITEFDEIKAVHVHTPVEINGSKVVLALDTLPIAYEKMETGEKFPYEMTAFGTDKKGEIDYGDEIITEHYKTEKEALQRYAEIQAKVEKGYDLYEIPPQGHSIEVVKEETQLDGVKLSPYDVVMKDDKEQAVLIGKTSKNVGQMEVFNLYALPGKSNEKLDGFVKKENEDGKAMWKAIQMDTWGYSFGYDALRKAALEEYTKDKVKETAQTLNSPDKEYVALNQDLVFLKGIGKEKEVVADVYKPMDGELKGTYRHTEQIFEDDGGTKIIDHGPTTLTWDTLEKRNQENFEKIAEAKAQRILHLPEKVMHMMPNQLKELRNNPELTVKPKTQEQVVVIGPKKMGKGMER